MRAEVLESQEHQPEVPLNRRERRAAARGGATTTGRIPVKAGPKLPPPPVRHRDYASRKRG
jgi:hypothetical protein